MHTGMHAFVFVSFLAFSYFIFIGNTVAHIIVTVPYTLVVSKPVI